MDWKEIVVGLLGIGLPALGWMLRTIWEDLREHQRDLQDYKLHVSENYVKKSEVEQLRDFVAQQFTSLHERMDEFMGERK
jgi:hypothetical protein